MADFETAPEGGIREVDKNAPQTPETAPEADGDESASSDVEALEGSDEE